MADYTVTGLINSLKKRGVIPVSQKTYDTPDLIRIFDEELRLKVVPFVMTVRENYFTSLYDQTIVSGQANYGLAPRSIGDKMKNLYYVDTQNREFEITRLDYDDKPFLQFPDTNQTGIPRFFYFQDDQIILIPTPDGTAQGTIRQHYYRRRSALVDVTAVGQITSINTGTGVLTLNNVPTTFTTAVTYDFVKATPNFKIYTMDATASAVTTSSITFATLPTGLTVGDYICLSQESPIPQISYELFPLLIQRSLEIILRGINDLAGSKKAEDESEKLEASARKLISDRVDENTKKIYSPNNISNWVWGRVFRW